MRYFYKKELQNF